MVPQQNGLFTSGCADAGFQVRGVLAKISTTVLAQQMLGTSEIDAPSQGATIVSNFIVERYFPTCLLNLDLL